MTVEQLVETLKAKDRARMLRREERLRREATVIQYGDVDCDRYDESWVACNARRVV
jgi:hypothetical protein